MSRLIYTISIATGGALIAGPALASLDGVPVPEPGMIGLFAAGVVGLIWFKHRNRK